MTVFAWGDRQPLRIVLLPALILLATLIPHEAHARLFKQWMPDDLIPISDFICNGVVERIENLEEESKPTGAEHGIIHCKAHIKILSVYKGNDAREVDIYYKLYPMIGVTTTNGPIFFSLKVGGRYRFFLNRGPHSFGYITALESNIDDLWAVEDLLPEEADNSPPFARSEATQLGFALFHRHEGSLLFQNILLRGEGSLHGSADPNRWVMQIWYLNGEYSRPEVPDAEFIFRGDRSLDPASWLAAAAPMTADKISDQYLGEELRIVQEHNFNSVITRGILDKVTPQTIILRNASINGVTQTMAAEIVRKDVVHAWVLTPLN